MLRNSFARSIIFTLLVTFPACSDDTGPGGGGATAGGGDAGGAGGLGGGGGAGGSGNVDGGGGMGGSTSCETGILINADGLRAESVAQLRGFFGLDAGFEDGTLLYRDGVTSIGNCPNFDQSAVLYSVALDAELVPEEIVAEWDGKTPHVNFTWGLNGYRYIHFSNEDVALGDLSWGLDRFPVSACLTLAEETSPARAAEIHAQLSAVAGEVPVDLFVDTIVCWGPGVDDENALDLDGSDSAYYASVLAVAAQARTVPEAIALEWSPVSYGFDWILGEATPITAPEFHPECLRTASASEDFDFFSSPSFPPPFGPGWFQNPTACQ